MYHNADQEALELYFQYMRMTKLKRKQKRNCIGCPNYRRSRRIAV